MTTASLLLTPIRHLLVRLRRHAVIVLPVALMACTQMPTHDGPLNAVVLPLQTAWYENRVVHYVTTDVSDAEVARAKGANFVPRLRELLPDAPGAEQRRGSALERVYAFVNAQQPTVFPSVPRPVGPLNRDLGYSPLWRMVQVTWQPGRTAVELKSEEAVLEAEDRGDVQLRLTDVLLNCAVIAVQGEAPLPGVRVISAPVQRR